MKLRASLLVCVSLLGLAACVPSAPAPSGSPTGWKEGYGGDKIVPQAREFIETTCRNSRKLRPALIRRALETEVDVADSICKLLNKDELVIEPVLQPIVNGIEKDAANYPEMRPRRLEIKKAYLSDPSTTPENIETVLLHEIAPLAEIPDKDWVRSGRLKLALLATRGRTLTEVVCERNHIYAQFSGATPPLARWLARKLGESKCGAFVEMMMDPSVHTDLEDSLRKDLSHAYLIGTLAGATRVTDERAMRDFEHAFISGIDRLPDSLEDFSVAMCSFAASSNDCGNIVQYIFGATNRQKLQAIGEIATVVDFDRASYSFALRLREARGKGIETGLTTTGRAGPEVSGKLLQAAIRGENWAHLSLLGNLQRDLRPNERAGVRLTSDFDWLTLLKDARKNSMPELTYPSRKSLKDCSPETFRRQILSIVDGEVDVPRCSPKSQLI